MSWTPNCSVSTYLLSFQKQKDKNDTTEWKKKEYVPKKMADGAVWTGGGGGAEFQGDASLLDGRS